MRDPQFRPYVLYNAAMSIDGKIATKEKDTAFSDTIDWREVHEIRSQVDGIIVGIKTVLADDPRLTVQKKTKNARLPSRIVIDSHLKIPPSARIIHYERDKYSTIVATTQKTLDTKQGREKKVYLESVGVKIISCQGEKHVDLQSLLKQLGTLGFKKILLEGGGTLAWGFLQHNLIDELRLFIAPYLIGGRDSTSLIMGEGFPYIKDAPDFQLKDVTHRQNYIILRYIK